MANSTILPPPKTLSSTQKTRTETEVTALRNRLRLAWEIVDRGLLRVQDCVEDGHLDEAEEILRELRKDARQGLADLDLLERLP